MVSGEQVMGKVKGDAEAFARAIAETEFESYRSRIEEAYKAALKMIEEARRAEEVKAEREIASELSRAEEKLRSVESSLQLQLKSERAALINEWVEKVIMEALNRIVRERREKAEWYVNFMKKLVERLKEEVPAENGGLVVRVAQGDEKLVEDMLSEAGLSGRVRLGGTAEMLGGLIVEDPEGTFVLDYRLDLLIENLKPIIRSRVAKLLEG